MSTIPQNIIRCAVVLSVAKNRRVTVECSDVDVMLTQAILPHWQVDYESMPGGSLSVWGEDETGAQWRIVLHAV